jgi:hypothetical protein
MNHSFCFSAARFWSFQSSGCPLDFLAHNELVGWRAAEKQKEGSFRYGAIYKQATP